MQEMKCNDRGKNLIRYFEGLRLNAYKDLGGVLTIGYGSTTNVNPELQITIEQAEKLLAKDMSLIERSLNEFIKYPCNSNEFSACCCLAYNIGVTRFSKSTLLKSLNLGDKGTASQEFLRWEYVDGKVVKGLKTRREAEKVLFLTPLKHE